MRTLLESEAFRNELPGWALRGFFCAASSAFWAVGAGFKTPLEIAGMVVGVGFWVVAYAGLCAWTWLPAWLRPLRFGAALKRAVWIKVGLTLLGFLVQAGWKVAHFKALDFLFWFTLADGLLGMISLGIVARIGSLGDFEQIAHMDSLGWTALATLIQGALVSVLIGLIALVVLGWWRLMTRKHQLSPARPAG